MLAAKARRPHAPPGKPSAHHLTHAERRRRGWGGDREGGAGDCGCVWGRVIRREEGGWKLVGACVRDEKGKCFLVKERRRRRAKGVKKKILKLKCAEKDSFKLRVFSEVDREMLLSCYFLLTL